MYCRCWCGVWTVLRTLLINCGLTTKLDLVSWPESSGLVCISQVVYDVAESQIPFPRFLIKYFMSPTVFVRKYAHSHTWRTKSHFHLPRNPTLSLLRQPEGSGSFLCRVIRRCLSSVGVNFFHLKCFLTYFLSMKLQEDTNALCTKYIFDWIVLKVIYKGRKGQSWLICHLEAIFSTTVW